MIIESLSDTVAECYRARWTPKRWRISHDALVLAIEELQDDVLTVHATRRIMGLHFIEDRTMRGLRAHLETHEAQTLCADLGGIAESFTLARDLAAMEAMRELVERRP